MPILFDRTPDKPAWLRAFISDQRDDKERRQDSLDMNMNVRPRARRTVGVPKDIDDIVEDVATTRRRSQRQIKAATLATNPAVTFVMATVGSALFALQLDRLTDPTRASSWLVLILSFLLLALSVWFVRSREVWDQLHKDIEDWNAMAQIGNDLHKRLEDLSDQLSEVIDNLE